MKTFVPICDLLVKRYYFDITHFLIVVLPNNAIGLIDLFFSSNNKMFIYIIYTYSIYKYKDICTYR